MDIFLGLDLGTTNCKVLAVDRHGQIAASASVLTPARKSPGLGIMEYDAEILWAVCTRLVRQVIEKLPSGQKVAGLAVTSMGESGVFVDKAGNPLTSIPTWYDHRTQPWITWWLERLTEAEINDITGLPLDYLYSVNKILWLRENDPHAFSHAYVYLCVADWITYCFTGQFTTSYSMASRTMLFDIHQRNWSETLLRISDLPPDIMPPAFPSSMLAGKVNRLAACATGLQAGIPVFIGGHDHICASIAAGAIEPGIVLDSAGTAEAIMMTLETPVSGDVIAASGLCCGCHTVRDHYYLLGALMGGGVLAWVSRLFLRDDSPQAINSLMDEAAVSPPGANGVQFLPYLDGSGPPDRDSTPWGAWLGLSLKHTRSDMVRAAIEGLSYGILHLLETAQTATNTSVSEIRCVGGSSQNAFWQQIKADILGLPIDTPLVADVTAQGAALLAAVGARVFRDEVEASRVAYRSGMRYEFHQEQSPFYDAAYRQNYQRNYNAHMQNKIQGV